MLATHLSPYISSALLNLVMPTHSPREGTAEPEPGRQSLPHAQPLACHRGLLGLGNLGWSQPV